MLKKRLNIGFMFVNGAVLLYLGVIFITNWASALKLTYQFFSIGIIILTLSSIGYLCINRWNSRKSALLIQVIGLIIVGLICYGNVERLMALVPVVLGFWLLILAVVKGITSYLMLHDHLPYARSQVFMTILYLLSAIALIFNPSDYSLEVIIVCGAYFILYGAFFVFRALTALIPESVIEDIDNRFQLAIPTMVGALLPPHLMKVILSRSESDQQREEFDVIKKDLKSDLEVIVHVAKSGPAQLGHCDLSYHGTLLSYGCYDPHVRYLFGTYGDGVAILAPKDEYLYNCLKNENKVLVTFGLVLNDRQKEQLNQSLLESFAKFEPFNSDEELKRKGIEPKGICDDYLSRVTRNVHNSHFYKIKEGKFKTFFVFYTNCVSYVSKHLSKIGFSILDFSGIISPGAYYDFLNNEFKSGKGCVIYRKVYTPKDAWQFKSHEREDKIDL